MTTNPQRFAATFLAAFAVATVYADTSLPLPVMGAPIQPQLGRFVFTLVPKAFQRNPELEMTVICELTDYGRTLPAVTPDQPAYYLAHDNGLQQFGDIYGGGHPPDQSYLDHVLEKSLSANGYRPATDAHHPDLVLFYTWGSHYAMDFDMRMKFPELARQQDIQRSSLLGGQRFAQEFARDRNGFAPWLNNSVRNDYLVSETRSSLYFVVVSAYDYGALVQRKRQLVWRARLTVDAGGVAMDESLVPLVLTAAPYFGRDMKESEVVARPVRRGKVELGPLNVLPNDAPADKK